MRAALLWKTHQSFIMIIRFVYCSATFHNGSKSGRPVGLLGTLIACSRPHSLPILLAVRPCQHSRQAGDVLMSVDNAWHKKEVACAAYWQKT
jgi:hypothetical protein